MKSGNNFNFELTLENDLRKFPWLIPVVTFFTGGILLSGIALCMQYFNRYHWTIVPGRMLAHAFFIVIVHDGAHKSITRTKFDKLLMNIGAALMLLPFYGEFFRKYHLFHHGHTNSQVDPLWPPIKKDLYENRRWLYILCECIPLLFTFFLIAKSNKHQKPKEKHIVNGVSVNVNYIILASGITICIVYIARPPIWFFVGTLFVLNIFSTLRHWCEHLGSDLNKSSNSFWFPLGMGIGNHDTHHHYPHVSWFVLMIGLFYRKKDTNPLKTVYGVMFSKSFIHYKEK